MHNDEFDRNLAQQLRVYAARIPDGPAPDPRAPRARRPSGLPVVAAGGAAVVAAAVLAIALLRPAFPPSGEASPSPTPAPTQTVEASPTTAPTTSANPSPTPAPTPITTNLAWIEAGSFGGPGTYDVASDVTDTSVGIVAVGTHFDRPLPIFGPTPPHEGLIWTSQDGRSWEAVTPPGTFPNVILSHVLADADGTLIAYGTEESAETATTGAWESADGRLWRRSEGGLPSSFAVGLIERGSLGYLASLHSTVGGVDELWLSADGRRWERVHLAAQGEFITGLGGGEEGYVVVGRRGGSAGSEAFTIASADGREWLGAASPPSDVWSTVPRGGDWLAIGQGIGGQGFRAPAVWFSANGLDWEKIGTVPAKTVLVGGGGTCMEFVAGVSGARGWLVANTTLSYPCSEGGVVTHGTQLISVDGSAWVELPFAHADPATGARGSAVAASGVVDGRLVLVGESDGLATFWLGEAAP